MQQAIDEAWKYQFLTYPNPAVGATVVKDGDILATQAHKEAGKPHAEVLALKEAYLKFYKDSPLKNMEESHDIHNFLYKNHNGFFKECEIFVTLEPCNHTGKTPACAMLLEAINIKKVVIGTLDPNKNASGGKQRLENKGIEVKVLNCTNCNNLLFPFIKWQNKNFTFFKLAMREDGTIGGGYITTQDSLKLVHKIRTKIDLLVIGGQTVRTDRPTLDTRFADENKPSDILIVSKQNQFDKRIPLFNVANRKVFIDSDISRYKQKFSMVEGGYNFLEFIKDDIDMLMLFVSHKLKSQSKFDYETLGFRKIYSYKINKVDEVVFLINKIK
jgi:diaminohydroxyphosphoribosylaminopyrimidine deaminase/5-amino-6-(5-phosphoribosylamino)uracil reductase